MVTSDDPPPHADSTRVPMFDVAQLHQSARGALLPGFDFRLDELGPIARRAVIDYLHANAADLMRAAAVSAAWERAHR